MTGVSAPVEIRPQPGPQETFLSTPADIAIYGGAAGGGKTWALVAEPLRHKDNPRFTAVIFRRTYPEITSEGGLWEESNKVYPLLGAKPRLTDLKWVFPSKATIRFAQMEHEGDVHKWQGSQIPFIGFDELTHFEESQFFYMLSRNRSTSGIKPYVRGTTNPDATSWVKRFLAPWVDKTYPLKATSGQILWMVRDDGVIHWYTTREDATEQHRHLFSEHVRPEHVVKSVTFVSARIYDNRVLLKINPEYLGNLMALPAVERARLLDGDWDALPTAGKVLNRAWFEVVGAAPVGRVEPVPANASPEIAVKEAANRQFDVRFWDFAASIQKQKGDDPDWTVGVKMRRLRGVYYVLDVVRFRATPGELETYVRNVATQDNVAATCAVRWEEEGGSSGKIASRRIVDVLAGFDARAIRPQGDKVTRAMPFAAQAEAGNVKLVSAAWNEGYLTELHHFPDASHDDQVDASSGAFNHLVQYGADVVYGPDIWSM